MASTVVLLLTYAVISEDRTEQSPSVSLSHSILSCLTVWVAKLIHCHLFFLSPNPEQQIDVHNAIFIKERCCVHFCVVIWRAVEGVYCLSHLVGLVRLAQVPFRLSISLICGSYLWQPRHVTDKETAFLEKTTHCFTLRNTLFCPTDQCRSECLKGSTMLFSLYCN